MIMADLMGIERVIKVKVNAKETKCIKAECFGPLAISPCISGSGRWSVRHIASGFAVCHDLTEDQARALVPLLLPLDWEVSARELFGHKAAVAEAVAKVRGI